MLPSITTTFFVYSKALLCLKNWLSIKTNYYLHNLVIHMHTIKFKVLLKNIQNITSIWSRNGQVGVHASQFVLDTLATN